VIVHCVTERQARHVRAAIGDRLAEVGLELHPGKTKVAYCKDSRRRGSYEVISFAFLGYAFWPRAAFDRTRKRSFTGFLPGVSAEKLTEMSRKAQVWKLNRRTTLTLAELARAVNPVLRGQSLELREHGVSLRPACRRIGLDGAQMAECGLRRVAPLPQGSHLEVGAVREVELELTSALGADERAFEHAEGVLSVAR